MLFIDKESISKIYEYQQYGSKRGNKGRIDFRFHNTILKSIFDNLISYFIEKSKNNKKYSIYFLRGLLAAEGYVSPSSKGALGKVGISSSSKKDQKLITKMLKAIGINASDYKHDVVIYSKENFDKILNFDLLKISKDRNKFEKLYRNFRYKT